MPVAAGTPRYENWLHWWMERFRCRLCPPSPWLGTSPNATSLLRPSAVVVRATVVGLAGRRLNPSRIGVRDMLSYQSLMPAAAGTPRFEKPELWRGTANWHGGFCYTPTPPLCGTSPRATGFRPSPERRGPSGKPATTSVTGSVYSSTNPSWTKRGLWRIRSSCTILSNRFRWCEGLRVIIRCQAGSSVLVLAEYAPYPAIGYHHN